MLTFASCEVATRAALEVAGMVVASETKCEQPYNNRCVTTYHLQTEVQGKPVVYRAGPNDASLRRDLPVGTHLAKEKWSLRYRINDDIVDDFPLTAYLVFGAIGLILLGISVARLGRRRVRSNSAAPLDSGYESEKGH